LESRGSERKAKTFRRHKGTGKVSKNIPHSGKKTAASKGIVLKGRHLFKGKKTLPKPYV